MRNHRIDIVVANKDRINLFWNSLDTIKNFDPEVDRIIVMDCSDNSLEELSKSEKYLDFFQLKMNYNFLFFKRRNWNMNPGAQLDYLRLILDEKIAKPKYTFFLQDHYLDKYTAVHGDTIPTNFVYDLNLVEKELLNDKEQVLFSARNGFRVSSSNPTLRTGISNQIHRAGSVPSTFCVDGCNYIVAPDYYLKYFANNPELLIKGDGSYQFAHVWESRICKILYDQNFTFYELSRNIKYKKISDLIFDYPDPCSVWMYFYDFPAAYVFYGRDIYNYGLLWLRRPGALCRFIKNYMKYDRNKKIEKLTQQ
jgi:hypothetical protein